MLRKIETLGRNGRAEIANVGISQNLKAHVVILTERIRAAADDHAEQLFKRRLVADQLIAFLCGRHFVKKSVPNAVHGDLDAVACGRKDLQRLFFGHVSFAALGGKTARIKIKRAAKPVFFHDLDKAGIMHRIIIVA